MSRYGHLKYTQRSTNPEHLEPTVSDGRGDRLQVAERYRKKGEMAHCDFCGEDHQVVSVSRDFTVLACPKVDRGGFVFTNPS